MPKNRKSRSRKPQRAASAPIDSPVFDTPEAAGYLRMSVPFLRAGRTRGKVGNGLPPPPYIQVGRSVRYLKSDLDAWLAARRVDRSRQP
jgi:hypothetical protein